ncbi:hypothetical protein MB46_01325 [Arthrobacter alpinus]|uniref:hypothetical protein n=1 Tax=Arthrobacter alpinus TaxID=656366 RepID=UPI0005C9511A|nr:hypothetical protein [Arthrobacter alpinus]ALV44357.1 hypothetical protein MB46_01325 [Arthrobacter alpinus]
MPFPEILGYWWVLIPLGGMAAGGFRALAASRERVHQRKIELYKLQHPEVAGLDVSAYKPAAVELAAPSDGYSAADVANIKTEHDAVNRRWLSYELDVAKLIDFPMMSDVREPLTVAFLRAKRDADALRPLDGAEISAKSRWDDYRNAVNAYVVAFEVAEKEAHRIKDSGYSEAERQRLGTARKLVKIAENEGASPAERQTAYKRARKELDGLIVLPDVTVAALEQKVARMIDGSK